MRPLAPRLSHHCVASVLLSRHRQKAPKKSHAIFRSNANSDQARTVPFRLAGSHIN